jgi:hypothetical protein
MRSVTALTLLVFCGGAEAAGCVGTGTLAKGFKTIWEDGSSILHQMDGEQMLMERILNGKTLKQVYRKYLPVSFQCQTAAAGSAPVPNAQAEAKYTWAAEPVPVTSLTPGKPHVDRGKFTDCQGKDHDIEMTSNYMAAGQISIGACTFDVHFIEKASVIDGKRSNSGWTAYSSELGWVLKSRFVAEKSDREYRIVGIEPK